MTVALPICEATLKLDSAIYRCIIRAPTGTCNSTFTPLLPITYQQRRDNAIRKAVAVLKPYVIQVLSSGVSAAWDEKAADPLRKALWTHVEGLKTSKDNDVTRLRLSKVDLQKAIWQAIRECLNDPTVKDHIKVAAEHRKRKLAEVADIKRSDRTVVAKNEMRTERKRKIVKAFK
jgi:hypothetical protein